jgi:glucose/arabinose dehydrogenase
MKAILRLALALSISAALHASTLPGFRVQKLGTVPAGEFLSSVAVDSHGTIYFTTTAGNVYRFAAAGSTPVAHVNTVAVGDSGLLGMALRDDRTAVVHYTTENQTYDVISSIDLTTGAESVLLSLVADKDLPSRGSSPEHHGGKPSIARDGSIFVGVGDYGGGWVASQPDWNGGKVWRILPDGTAHWYARGFRNPFGVVFDDANERLIASDNGAAVDDEINVVHDGDFCGWPFTSGNGPLVDGAIAPAYVFPAIVAPTGITALNDKEPLLNHGYLLGSFVAKAIYYIADVDARPLQPIALMQGDAGPIIDVTQAATGEIYFGTGTAIWRFFVPQQGDCNGDGLLDGRDLTALAAELADGHGSEPATAAPGGSIAGSWGCDVNADGVIDARDLTALESIVSGRPRVARH